MRKILGLALAIAAASACDDSPTGPASGPTLRATRPEQEQIVVMTRNVFVGAAVEDVFDVADLAEIPIKAAEMWAAIQATDFEARAAAFAEEVAGFDPHFIGLQEVTTFYKQTPSDFDLGGFGPGIPATEVALDFLPLFVEALEDAGLSYEVVAVSPNFTAEVPMVDAPDACSVTNPNCLSDMRLLDADVILARSDVDYDQATVATSNFPDALVLKMPPFGLPLPRGWASVDATVAGLDFRFAVTHLEPPDQDGVVVPDLEVLQRAQAEYLHAVLTADGKPVVLVGDLNTDAYGASTATYGDFLQRGWVDAWGNRGAGYTCCQLEDLYTWPSILDRRVDLILLHGDFALGDLGYEGAVQAWTVGSRGSDRLTDGMWPSDHAGVVATIRPGH